MSKCFDCGLEFQRIRNKPCKDGQTRCKKCSHRLRCKKFDATEKGKKGREKFKDAARKRASDWAKNNVEKARINNRNYKQRHKIEIAEKLKNDMKSNPTKYKERKFRNRYDITLNDYTEMCLKQENKCAICKEVKPLCVDHCHMTGKIRGLLCRSCNSGIGQLKDNKMLLLAAVEYLEKI